MGKGLHRDGRESGCVAVTQGGMGREGGESEATHGRSVNMLWLLVASPSQAVEHLGPVHRSLPHAGTEGLLVAFPLRLARIWNQLCHENYICCDMILLIVTALLPRLVFVLLHLHSRCTSVHVSFIFLQNLKLQGTEDLSDVLVMQGD